MDNATYAVLTRQSGLLSEMRIVANNVANASTTGFKAEGMVFSEYISSLDHERGDLSMAAARIKSTNQAQGTLSRTDGTFDLAIEGDGYFLVETAEGPRLTRAGHFTSDGFGTLMTSDGDPVLDVGGAPVFVPNDAGPVGISADGTISAEGRAIGQIGLVVPLDPDELRRQTGTLFDAPAGVEPAPQARVLQGFLEVSNVNPILQMSRMIEVQRAYELGQSFMQLEDDRIRGVIQAMGR
ncbi:flagellar hook-basal body complex protein [Salipiger sp. IMCC34102]|uniref:flagellar hook-basal body complex protein n=1 Tax=Salipiger sp. IMCC34102 TaxID=2510647 RepID=UPI00101D0BA8|nr:flagellar hook-basal body complex protein [Salipiger sp. IMCC34102]RYH01569.1 flagellar hook-basal body complex protein [Salipiger sp. IMCC34102]